VRGIRLAGLLLGALLVALGTTAAHAEMRLLGSDRVRVDRVLANSGHSGIEHCQAPERVPAGTTALLLSLSPREGFGPAVSVELRRFLHGERRLTDGRRAPGWTEGFVLVPLRRPVRRTILAEVCLTAAPGAAVSVHGTSGPPLRREEPNGPRLRVDFLHMATARRVTVRQSTDTSAVTRAAELLGAAFGLVVHVLGG
jgi:hypothetical protein